MRDVALASVTRTSRSVISSSPAKLRSHPQSLWPTPKFTVAANYQRVRKVEFPAPACRALKTLVIMAGFGTLAQSVEQRTF